MRLFSVLLFTALFCAIAAPAYSQGTPSDDRIYDHVRLVLANDADVKGGTFDVTVKNGVVTMEGTVDTEKIKDRATKLAKKVKGVKDVVNKLRVRYPDSD